MDEQNVQPTDPAGGNNAAKWIIGILVVALVVWGISATRKKSSEQATNTKTQGETYKIGALMPLTGDAASYGEPGKNIYQIAIDEINNAGGVNGKKLELIIEDSKCSGKDAANAMQKLVNINKVQVVMGGFCSSESLAAEPIATQNKVALLSPGSSSPKLTGVSHYFFRNYPSDASQGSVLAELANKKGWKKIAFLQEQTDYALGIYNAFSDKFKSLDGNVIKEEFPTDSADFRSQLTKLKAENPDALFLDTQTPTSAGRILKQLKDFGWKPPILLSDVTPSDTATVSPYKDLLEGALAAEFGTDSSNPKYQHLVQAYKQKFGVDLPFPSYAQTEYDAVYMIKDAIANVGYDGSTIADWSRTVKDWDGASGKVTIMGSGDRASGHKPEILRDGKIQPLSE